VVAIAAYLVFHNLPEKQVARHFLADVNNGRYDQAYRDWTGIVAIPPISRICFGILMYSAKPPFTLEPISFKLLQRLYCFLAQ
jgi:hypothetical protein